LEVTTVGMASTVVEAATAGAVAIPVVMAVGPAAMAVAQVNTEAVLDGIAVAEGIKVASAAIVEASADTAAVPAGKVVAAVLPVGMPAAAGIDRSSLVGRRWRPPHSERPSD
jgi:hypothetical protein